MSRCARIATVLNRIDMAVSRPIYWAYDRIVRSERAAAFGHAVTATTRWGWNLPPIRIARWLTHRKLFWFIVAVEGTWLLYHQFADRVGPRQDALLLGAMSFVLAETAFGLIMSTERWRLRAMGLLALLCGTSILYFTVFDGTYHWFTNITRRPEVIQHARSFFMVATVALGITVNRWLWKNRKHPPAWWEKDKRYPNYNWREHFFD